MDLSVQQQRDWDRLISEAKSHVRAMENHRMSIARVAIEACTIVHGGRANIDGYEVETLKKFAEGIGIKYRTLHTWVSIHEKVAVHMPVDWVDEVGYTTARAIHDEVRKQPRGSYNKSSPKEKITAIHSRMRGLGESETNLAKALKHLKTAHHNLANVSYTSIEPKKLKEMSVIAASFMARVRSMTEDVERQKSKIPEKRNSIGGAW